MPPITSHMSTKIAGPVEHGRWRIDGSRSTIAFRVRHFGVATVRGRFGSFAGRLDADDDGLRIDGHVDVDSVETGNAVRDARLRSEFFSAGRFPAIALTGRSAGGTSHLIGELTIRGVSRPVELDLRTTVNGDGSVRLRANGSIRRSEFGLDWDALRQAGHLLVSDEVRVRADVVFDHP